MAMPGTNHRHYIITLSLLLRCYEGCFAMALRLRCYRFIQPPLLRRAAIHAIPRHWLRRHILSLIFFSAMLPPPDAANICRCLLPPLMLPIRHADDA
jgi:hypothetical protein